MKQNTQEKKLFTFGISTLALVIFPLAWFLSQAILFRELTEQVTRNVLVLIAIPLGSTLVFLLFLGMDRLIKLVPRDSREVLEARMFVGPSIFMIFLKTIKSCMIPAICTTSKNQNWFTMELLQTEEMSPIATMTTI